MRWCSFDDKPRGIMLGPVLIFLLSNLAFAVTETLLCPSGCYCPSEEVAHCCLFPSDYPSPVQCHLPGRRQISANANSALRWPTMDTCLTRWTELSVQLLPDSWPPAPPKRSCTAQLRRISISGGGLITLSAQHFQTLFGLQENQLKVLVIQNTRLENLQAGLFDRLSLKALSEIHLNQNYNLSYKGFGVSVFSNLPQLETLNLESNRIERLDFVRWGFPTINKVKSASRLISLNLANNSLTYIKPGAFSLFPFLEVLSLANNKLSSLSSDVFEGLTSLKRLDLSGNLLNIMGLKNSIPDFSITLANLEFLDISMNPLMRSVYTDTDKWWLSSGCPASLTHLIMNHIDVDQGQESPLLPRIDWVRCQKLAQVEIQQIPRLSCLPAPWLRSDVLPTHPALITSATRVCIPPITTTTTTVTAPSTRTTTIRPRPAPTTATTGSEPLGLRELIVSSVVGAVLFLLLVLLIIIVFMCRRRRWMYGPVAKENGKLGGGASRAGRRERPITSTYIPAPDCQLPLADNDDGELSASSMRQTESRILYDENGVPVCSVVVPEVGSPTAVMLSDGTLAYVPQFIPISGRATPSSHTGLLDNSYRSSRLLLKQPVMVPLMTSHASLATSQIDFPRQQQRPPSSSYQPLGKTRPRLPNHHHHNGSSNNAPTSTLSCKSTSFSSLGGSVHSEIPLHASAFSASPPPLATVVQATKPSSPPSASPSAVSSTEEPSLIVGPGGAVTTASTTTSTANPSPNSHSDDAVA
ncbi:TRL4 interactor with leucine rich repeat area [Echinococcus granulosus]|uniref:Leucine rich repeat domain containing protein n=1 Tax=Echinococcus granulosus TaxID=6210 RepID=A0A068WGN9_ECHGR|nr:TRL4 interactor with leucine rich repeat area [Echinococcus granulosus]CDS16831.1 Leucine rich repeat domain containing protein [Echinococcus granulosus]